MPRPLALLAVTILLAAGCQPTALMQGFIPGDRGTIRIPLGSPDNGIGVEVLRAADCTYPIDGMQSFPTPKSFTLNVEGGPAP